MAQVPALKRGHHSDFALSEQEIQDLVDYCTDKRTKAMILLAGLGVPMRGIVEFNSRHLKMLGNTQFSYFLDIEGVTEEPIRLTPKQYQLLNLFPNGFGVTNVTIWRRIKRQILKAGSDGIVTFDPDHVPFPAALAWHPTEPQLSSRQMVRWCLERLHALQSRLPNQGMGTIEACPHKDCERIRRWMARQPASQ